MTCTKTAPLEESLKDTTPCISFATTDTLLNLSPLKWRDSCFTDPTNAGISTGTSGRSDPEKSLLFQEVNSVLFKILPCVFISHQVATTYRAIPLSVFQR